MSDLKPTLWELTDQFLALGDRILEAGDLTPEMEAEFDALTGALGDKMLRCSEFRRTLLHNATFNKEEAQGYSRRAKAFANGAGRMEKYMLRCLLRANLTSLRAADGRRLWTVGMSPGRVIVDDLAALPDNVLRKFDPEPDLPAIRALIKAGVPVAAHISEPEPTLLES